MQRFALPSLTLCSARFVYRPSIAAFALFDVSILLFFLLPLRFLPSFILSPLFFITGSDSVSDAQICTDAYDDLSISRESTLACALLRVAQAAERS